MSRIYFDRAFGDLKGRAAQCLRGGVKFKANVGGDDSVCRVYILIRLLAI